MCIICTGEIYKENFITLQILDVAYCSDLTSEKLQEVLIQCKNLTILRCHSCTSLTSIDLQNNINLTKLWCFYCISLTSIISSEGITSINLIQLECSSCTLLNSLDLRSNINLLSLGCSSCKSLTSLDLRSNINLKTLWCDNCSSLTSLDLPKGYRGNIDCSKCPWITQYKNFPNNYQRLIIIQRWYRKLLLIKYMKSQEFIEWIYSPTNIGGRLYKKWLLKNLK